MNFINSIVHGSAVGHPNKRAIKNLRCYESIRENTSGFFVHVTAHSCKSVVLFTCFFLEVYSRENQN